MNKASKNSILSINFNQEQDLFAVGTENGFKVYQSDPLKLKFERNLNGGIGHIEMLHRSNIMALVGGGFNPKYPLNKVMLWDELQQRICGEMSFRSDIKNVKLKLKQIVVVLEQKIFIYDLNGLKLLNSFDTILNIHGLVSTNTDSNNNMVCFMGQTIGEICIYHIDQEDDKQITKIKAHQSNISCIEINSQGTLLATASDKGTLIRIFNIQDQTLLQELRRGSEYAQIYQLSFQIGGQYLACASDSGTIHIFIIKSQDHAKLDKEVIKNKSSKLSFMKNIIPYFNSEWSFAKFRISNSNMKVCFGNQEEMNNHIIVLSYDNSYSKAKFNPYKISECTLIEQQQII